jgi:regulator of replication initiation timing
MTIDLDGNQIIDESAIEVAGLIAALEEAEDNLKDIRQKLEDSYKENSILRSELTDAQRHLDMLRGPR